MQINRRSAIKQFMIIAGGLFFLPSCGHEEASVHFKNFKIDKDQQALMAELAEEIVPATDSPGAKEINAHLFALKMVDDCLEKADQVKFTDGLKEFEKLTRERYSSSFLNCTSQERKELLKDIENRNNISPELEHFYFTTKSWVIRGYMTSEYYLTKVQNYQLTPGVYEGCVPVSNFS